MKLTQRRDVDIATTWDLSHMYANDEAFYQALDSFVTEAKAFGSKYCTVIDKVEPGIDALTKYQETLEQFLLLSTYASLHVSEDRSNTENINRSGLLQMKTAEVTPLFSAFDQIIKNTSVTLLNDIKERAPDFTRYIDTMLREKNHSLSIEAEEAVSALSGTLDAPYAIYNTNKLVDMKFDSFAVGDKTYPLSFGLYEDEWEYAIDHEIRHAAYDTFHQTLADNQNTVAAVYSAHVLKEKALGKLKNFDTTIDSLLYNQEVPSDFYHRQIDLIMEHLAPHMRRFAKHLQHIHKLDKMTYKDLKLVVDPNYEPEITIDEAQTKILEGLSILGDDYARILNRAFTERWIDFPQNIGKSTGAFCSNPYSVHPYVLISWTKKMRELFVLAHELGHTGHLFLAGQHQSLLNVQPSLYFIEAPSTMNELLMAKHLKETAQDARMKRWVLSTLISRTYYHNFVTHFIEASYQREVYRRIDRNEPLSAVVLKELMLNALREF